MSRVLKLKLSCVGIFKIETFKYVDFENRNFSRNCISNIAEKLKHSNVEIVKIENFNIETLKLKTLSSMNCDFSKMKPWNLKSITLETFVETFNNWTVENWNLACVHFIHRVSACAEYIVCISHKSI